MQTAFEILAEDILTIPELKSYITILSPILDSLAKDRGKGWLAALRIFTNGTYRDASNRYNLNNDHSISDYRFLRKVYFLNNFCTCALSQTQDGSISSEGLKILVSSSASSSSSLSLRSSSPVVTSSGSVISSSNSKIDSAANTVLAENIQVGGGGGSWIGTVCETLHSMPLITILNHLQFTTSLSSTSSTMGLKSSTEREDNSMQVDEEYQEESEDQEFLNNYCNPNGEGDDNNSEKAIENEQTFALAGGVKRLEYRLSAVLRGLRERDLSSLKDIHKTVEEKKVQKASNKGNNVNSPIVTASSISVLNSDTKKEYSVRTSGLNVDKLSKKIGGIGSININMKMAFTGMESVIKVLTTSQAISALTDAININNMENISAVFAVITSYTKILMSSPCGADVLPDSTPLSLKILNSMAFSRPKDPLTKRLWGLLNAFDTAVVSDANNRGYGTPTSTSLSSTATFGGAINSSNMGVVSNNNTNPPYSQLTIKTALHLSLPPSLLCEGLQSALYLLCCVLSHQLTATDDEEFFDSSSAGAAVKTGNNTSGVTTDLTISSVPNVGTGSVVGKCPSLQDIKLLIPILKAALYRLYWSNPLVDTYAPSNSGNSSGSMAGCSSLEDLQVRMIKFYFMKIVLVGNSVTLMSFIIYTSSPNIFSSEKIVFFLVMRHPFVHPFIDPSIHPSMNDKKNVSVIVPYYWSPFLFIYCPLFI